MQLKVTISIFSAAGFVQDRTFSVIYSPPKPSAFAEFAELMRIPEGESPAVQARQIAELATELGVMNQDFYVRLADFLEDVPLSRIEEIPADLAPAAPNESLDNVSGELSDESDAFSETNEEQELGTMVYNDPPPPIYTQNSDAKSQISSSSITRREIPSEDSEAVVPNIFINYINFPDIQNICSQQSLTSAPLEY